MVYGKSTKSKARRTTKVYRKRSTRKATPSIKKAVKTVIRSMAELKISPSFTNDDVIVSTRDSSVVSIPTIFNLMTPLNGVVQGDGQGNREGNKITLRKYPFKMLINAPVDKSSASVNVVGKFIIARLKTSISVPVSADFEELFQDGNGTTDIQNSVFQNFLPFNKNYWDIKKTFSFSLNNSTEPLQPFEGGGQYKMISIDLSKYLPKTIIYNDTTPAPTNCGLYGFFIMGSPITSSDLYSVNVSTSSWAQYYDL